MTEPRKRRLIGGKFAIDAGEAAPLLDACPCCGAKLNEAAADAVLRSLAKGDMTFGQALELAKLMCAKMGL
jgi:hypothetical protein